MTAWDVTILIMTESLMNDKEAYREICLSEHRAVIPVFSRMWWMDAVCGEENWRVWIDRTGGRLNAVMPYYIEKRGDYTYITKALLTQNNGIIFFYPDGQKSCGRYEFEERVISRAVNHIESLGLDVYEQQYHYGFHNWVPFYWRNFTQILRYTFVIEDTSDLDKVLSDFSTNYRNKYKKGCKNATVEYGTISAEEFYTEHEKIFLKQGLPCPFTLPFWKRLYKACTDNDAGQMLLARGNDGNIHAVMFLIWDDMAVYQLLGGAIPEYSSSEAYSTLVYEGIKIAGQKGLSYDFEGSVIKRINRSMREFGCIQKPYFRIRKVFNPEIVRAEAERYIATVGNERTGIERGFYWRTGERI